MAWSHFSGDMLRSILSRVMPALWTTMSTPPKRFFRSSAMRVRRCGVRDVGEQQRAVEAVRHLAERAVVLGAVEADDVRPLGGEQLGGGFADPARRARDQRDLAVERAARPGGPAAASRGS